MGTADKPALRRYFFDTEFCDDQVPGFSATLMISLGILNEDGREFYAVCKDTNIEEYGRISPWLKDNVLEKLPPQQEWVSLDEIRQGVLDMIDPADEVEFWARNGSYDHYLLCRLFGGMGSFRDILKEKKGIEKITFRDTHELRRVFGAAALPPLDDKEKHVAINDARQEKQEFDFYRQVARKKPVPGFSLNP